MAIGRNDPAEPGRECAVPGCGGTMRFKPRQTEAPAPHTLEWPWRATWVCDRDAAHVRVATVEEEAAMSRRE